MPRSLPARWFRCLLAGLAWLVVASVASAGTVTLSSTPPGVTSRVAPNIVVTFDDSGSMNATAIPDAMDANYARKYYYSAQGNPIYFDPTVTYVVPPDAYGVALGTPTFSSAWRDGYCANTLTKQCWSPSQSKYLAANKVDLSTTFFSGFLANTLAGNNPCSKNANEFSTWYDNGNCAQRDIPLNVRGPTGPTTTTTSSCLLTACSSFTSRTVDDGAGTVTTYSCFLILSCNITTVVTPYEKGGFYYVCTSPADDNTCTFHSVSKESTTIQQNFAIWYSYYRTRNLNARAAVGRVFGSIADNAVRVAWQTLQAQGSSSNYNTSAGSYSGPSYGPLASGSKILELVNAPTNCTATSVTETCWRSQFMNWLYGAPASGGTPTRVATAAAGEFYKRKLATSPTSQDPYWNGATNPAGEITCRKNFNMTVTDGYWNGDSPSPVTPTVATAVTLPDGTSYSVTDSRSKIFWNQSSALSTPSLSDIAFSYWANDLRPDLTDNVPPYITDLSTGVTSGASTVDSGAPKSNLEVYFNPANDPANWQHMSQYMVTMGISGTLAYPDDYAALRTGTKPWPTPTVGGGASNIDDTWHAAVSSRGGYFSAADPNSLVSSLSAILSSVVASSSTALTLSLSSSVLTASAIAYDAGFDTTDWSGYLKAYPVSLDDVVSTVFAWSAGDLLKQRAASDRLIATSTAAGTGLGVSFTYATISATEKAALDSSDGTGSTATTDNLGSSRVDWLRGSSALEGTTFRSRAKTPLGAIFGSQPSYVASPSGGYSDTFASNSPEAKAIVADASNSYAAFQSKYAQRQAIVYVGANDGMLHAFDARLATVTGATPGKELWAYVPASVYGNLPAQSKLSNFNFTPTVDGSPVVGDVFFNSAYTNTTIPANNSTAGWHTLLVGSLRYGGRGVFGIDITDPSTINSVSTLTPKVLWEFNASSAVVGNSTPANLGYTFGTPVITRVAYDNGSTAGTNGRWVVLVPGGYFPDGSTVAAASNTFSSLFVLDAQTGALLKEIRTPSGTTSHGMTTPAVGDYDGDQVADVAFAGDIDGNVWRIDLSAATLASTTLTQGVSLLFKPATANAQSITTAPRLLADPTSSYFMVIFGTGRYLSTADSSSVVTQSLYGLRDPGTTVATPITVAANNLVRQTEVVDAASGGIGVTNNAVAATASGWYLPLDTVTGERVVVTPALDSSNNTVTFSTLIPTSSDPCTTAASGSVLALDGTTGSAAFGVSIGGGSTFASGYTLAGAHVTGAASSGALYTAASLSGGISYATGQITPAKTTFGSSIPTARRRSWRPVNSEN